MTSSPAIGIIGGTGLGAALMQEGRCELVTMDTPFGPPSAPLRIGEWAGRRVAFLARHGPGHVLPPSAVPYRANIFALKKAGVTCILASGAAGSLREHIRPGDVVAVDQVIDRTTRRAASFFDEYLAVHVEMAEPMCPHLRKLLLACADRLEPTLHPRGTYLCMEGPQFSTAAESHMHRAWGADLIGMTCMPEAKLAREAEMCYALIALPTDYDAWRPHDPRHSRQALIAEIGQNLQRVCEHGLRLLQEAIRRTDPADAGGCSCRQALELAIWSERQSIDPRRVQPLRLLLEKYITFE